MSSPFWRKAFTPSRLVALLGLLTITCAVLIANFSIDEGRTGNGYAQRAQRLGYVHDVVADADYAKAQLNKYEATQSPEDKEAFLQACDQMAAKVNHLRQAEHMSEDQSDQIVDLCVSIRQQLTRLGATSADRMQEAGYFLDRIHRVVLGFGMDELRLQDQKLEEQTKAAALNRRMTVGMAGIIIVMVAAIVFLVIRLTRLEQLATVCAWTHRLLYEGQWVSLERYLERRFGIRASDGITTEQAAKLMAEDEINGQELVRLIEFEKMAGDRAKEANRAIHAVRNHLTAVLCYSEMAGSGDPEAQREMASRVLTHASTISSEVDMLHNAVRSFNPGPPDLRVVRSPEEEQQRTAAVA
ncbi:MAG: hypothetical protein ABSE62_12515 [Chthoniobacteraceae bacterium]|jgi:hypothetical protein